MRAKYYFPRLLGAKLPFLENLAGKAGRYSAQLNVTPEDLAFLSLARDQCRLLVDLQQRAARFAQAWTVLRKACSDGPSGPASIAWPVWTGPATAPFALEGGTDRRLRALIGRWKVQPGYTAAIGRDLGLIGAKQTLKEESLQPVLRIALVAGRPELHVRRRGMNAVEVEVDRGDGFKFFTLMRRRAVIDNQTLLAPGVTRLWKYRAIYRRRNGRVGQWSAIQTTPVMGI